jgi:hypothetical protein
MNADFDLPGKPDCCWAATTSHQSYLTLREMRPDLREVIAQCERARQMHDNCRVHMPGCIKRWV